MLCVLGPGRLAILVCVGGGGLLPGPGQLEGVVGKGTFE